MLLPYLLKEFGVLGIPSKTCKLISDDNKNVLINLTVIEIKQNFSVSIVENMKVLPTPQWTPKIYKSLVGTVLIIASKKCY